MSSAEKKWLGVCIGILCLAYVEFLTVYLLLDPRMLKSSTYTYYQTYYYDHMSRGQLPWIGFRFEYPPLAAFAILVPAFFSGLNILTVTVLRSLVSLVCTGWMMHGIMKNARLGLDVRISATLMLASMTLIVPNLYFGLFDWHICLINLLLAISLFAPTERLTTRWVWPLIFLGGSVKLVHFFAIPFLYRKGDLAKAPFRLSVAALGLFHLPFVLFGFHEFKVFVAYHRLRSIDCFSIYGTALEALSNLGLVKIVKGFEYGSYDLTGPLPMILAKISLPAFLVIVAVLVWKYGSKATLQQSFGAFSAAVTLYPVISKVSGTNYCVWAVAAVIGTWLAGYSRMRYIKQTSVLLTGALICEMIHDRLFDDFMMPQVPWRSIIVSVIRLTTYVAIAWLILAETRQLAANDKAVPAMA